MSKQDLEDFEKESTQNKKQRLLPKKAEYRMRAHINPFNDTPFPYPLNPNYVDWAIHYPKFFGLGDSDNEKIFCNTQEHPLNYDKIISDDRNGLNGRHPDFLDIGCGFGGLVFELAKNFQDKLILGMEIRDKLVNFGSEKIRGLRIESKGTQYNNAAIIRTNAMRHLIQYFRKESIENMFFCFADPHFKKANHRRRIINTGYLSEYAFLLKPKGRIYCITDVQDLHNWQEGHLLQHNQFRKLDDKELEGDVCLDLIQNSTEEGQKVTRNKGNKWCCVFEKI